MGFRYNNRKWKDSMRLRLDYNNMMTDFVGTREGFTKKEIRDNMSIVDTAYNLVQLKRGRNMMGWSELPYNQEEILDDVIQTAYCGEMLKLNTYDQPGVEAGKQATFALLGKRGYEDKKEELENATKKREDFTIA